MQVEQQNIKWPLEKNPESKEKGPRNILRESTLQLSEFVIFSLTPAEIFLER